MISLTRRVTFSSGHRYWREDMSREANRELFGQWASPFNHGHNYFLEATIRGRIDPDTGMVINIKWLDELLDKVVVADFDQRSLNDEVPEFKDLTPSIENILRVVEGRLGAMPKGIELERLRLEETPTLWGELELASTEMIKLTRSYEFAASHRLHSPSLTAEENAELFGKCNNEAGHGHNYIL